jgi:hypothetical protein
MELLCANDVIATTFRPPFCPIIAISIGTGLMPEFEITANTLPGRSS